MSNNIKHLLRPCAHCGSIDLNVGQENPYSNEVFVGCQGCADYDWYRYETGKTEADAIVAWNEAQEDYEPRKRKPDDGPGEPPQSFDEKCSQVWAECRKLDSGRNY